MKWQDTLGLINSIWNWNPFSFRSFILRPSFKSIFHSFIILDEKCGLPLQRFEPRRVLSVGEEEHIVLVGKAAKCFLRCLTPSSSNSSYTELPLPLPPMHYGMKIYICWKYVRSEIDSLRDFKRIWKKNVNCFLCYLTPSSSNFS